MKKLIRNFRVLLLPILLLVGVSAMAQRTITGTVISADDNLGIPGAQVVVRGTTTGTTTDFNGRFSMNVPSEATHLVFSFMGMETQEVAIGGRSTIDVTLASATLDLDAVVVIGFGSQRRREVTGSVASVSAEDFNPGIRQSPIGLLQGQVAGLTIQRTEGGNPTNTGFNVQIRGFSTLGVGAGSSPLFVVDGIPVNNIDNISPDDILSIDVLRDGSAAAIYGTRGTNGVILITTRRGAGPGQNVPTTVEYSGWVSVSTIKGGSGMASAEEFRNLSQLSGGRFNPVLWTGPNGETANTDWIREVTRPAAVSHHHNVAISGAGPNLSYRGSLTHRNQQGIARNNARNEFIGTIALDQRALDGWLTVQYDLSYMHYRNDFHTFSFSQAATTNPTLPVYDPTTETGFFHMIGSGRNNPVERMHNLYNHQVGSFFRGSIRPTVHVQAVPGLSLSGFAAFEQGMNWRYWYNGIINHEPAMSNLAGIAPDRSQNQLFEGIINYVRGFGLTDVTILAGTSLQSFLFAGHSLQNGGFPTNLIRYYDLGQGDPPGAEGTRMAVGSGRSSNSLAAFFTRVNLVHNDRYMLSVSIRREGSSRFGAHNRWGNFPAASVGWNISREDFMSDVNFVNDLRVRFGFGITGNDLNQSLRSMELYTSGGMFWYNGQWVRTYTVNQNANPDLRWERKFEYNLGIDFALFNNRVFGTIDAYIRNTRDLLWNYEVPSPPWQYGSLLANAGQMTSRGIEFTINAIPVRTRGFTWTTTPIVSFNDNRITRLSDPELGFNYDITFAGGVSGPGMQNLNTQKIIEGRSVGSWWGFRFLGFDAQGRRIYESEIPGQGTIVPLSASNPGRLQFLGNAQPLFTFGWNNTMRFRNWDLSMLFRGCVGSTLFNVTRMAHGPQAGSNSQNVIMHDVPAGVPRETQFFSDFYLESGSHIKLDNLTLGYSFPFQNNRFIRSARAFFTAQNVFTITGYSGRDPEVNTTSVWSSGIDHVGFYPVVRNFMVGVNFTFY